MASLNAAVRRICLNRASFMCKTAVRRISGLQLIRIRTLRGERIYVQSNFDLYRLQFNRPKVAFYSTKDIDEGLQLGDYPVLPWKSSQTLPPRGWWDDQDRRNKEDPLHEEDDVLNMWVFDEIENNGKYTRWQALGQLLVMFSLLGGVYYLSVLYDAPSRKPCVDRQFPYDNLYLARGGEPGRTPSDKQKKNNRIKSTYGEFVS